MVSQALATAQQESKFTVGLRVHSFNWRMRQARQAKGLTQKALADLAQVSIAVIQALECLRREYTASWDTLDIVADVLEQPVQVLFPSWLRVKALKRFTDAELPLPLSESLSAESDDVIQGVLQGELAERIEKALASLPERERAIIELRYGFTGTKPLMLQETATKFGVTRERIRQIEETALRRLRHPRRGLAAYARA